MPHLDSILITTEELQEIFNQVAAKKYTGAIVIIDCIYSWTVRDNNGFLITDIKKTTQP